MGGHLWLSGPGNMSMQMNQATRVRSESSESADLVRLTLQVRLSEHVIVPGTDSTIAAYGPGRW